MKHKPLNEQVIVITGASSGIGLCTALLAAERGAQVVLLARSGQTLDEIVQAIAVEGGRAHAMTVDVSDREALQRTLIEILTLHGRIDTWVNNAGVAPVTPFADLDMAEFDSTFQSNVRGLVELTHDDRATLYGAFLSVADKLLGDDREQALAIWKRKGQRSFEAAHER